MKNNILKKEIPSYFYGSSQCIFKINVNEDIEKLILAKSIHKFDIGYFY